MPANFFALLKDGMEYILGRFPGLEIQRLVPCPGHGGSPCDYEFDLVNLEKARRVKTTSYKGICW